MHQQDAFGTELSDFSRLPRPQPLLPDNPSLVQLRQAFPFLFKPNRAIALHARVPGEDPGHPADEPHGRWLVRLGLGELQDELPACLAVIGQDGWLSLWCYQEETGLRPLRLELVGDGRITGNRLRFRDEVPAKTAVLPVELIRASGLVDEEARHHMTLDTTEGSHRLTLDFGDVLELPRDPVPCEISQHPARTSALGTRQIGGWCGGESFHWCESKQQVFRGGGRRRRPVEIAPQIAGIRLLAGVRGAGITVLGGQTDRLSLRRDDDDAVITADGAPLCGHVYSLALIKAAGVATSGAIVLVGCDDHVLYVLDTNGELLQKVHMGGLVDAILPLGHQRGEWEDLALLVRNRGLYCARLFLDRLRLEPSSEFDRKDFLSRANGLLGQAPLETLGRWLRLPTPVERMIAIRLILDKPTDERIALFAPESGLLRDLDDYSTSFLAHGLQRALRRLEKQGRLRDEDNQHAGRYLDLFLSMANGSFHSRMAVRQLEGWLIGLLQDAEEPGIRGRLERLRETLPDAKHLYARMARQACEDDESLVESAMAMLGSLYERLEYDRLFNEHVLIPRQGHGQVRVLTMLPGRDGVTTQVYAPRGTGELQSFRLDKILSQGDESQPWSPSLERSDAVAPGTIRALLPLGEDQLLVIAADRIGHVARGEPVVHWQPPASQALWSGACGPRARGCEVAVAGDWSPHPRTDQALVQLMHWDGASLHDHGNSLPAPRDWNRRTQVRALAWDEHGGLWAVTADQGELLHWSRTQVRDQLPPTVVARIGVALYGLALIPGLTITGGADGAVRAFERAGGLRWLYPTAGPVRSLEAIDSTVRIKGRQPRIALATEAEHVVLLDGDGRQLAMLFLPNTHPFSLTAGELVHDRQLHLAVGTLEGEVRVLEVVADHWEARYADLEDDRLSERLQSRHKTYYGDQERLGSWCSPEVARREPLQTAWAACQLMRHHNDPSQALAVAAGLRGMHPATRRLRALLFGILGRRMPQIEHAALVDRLDRESRQARDGAVAALLDGLADEDELTRPTMIRILARAHLKVRAGRPFTASALLRLLSRLPPQLADLGDMVLMHGLRHPRAATTAEALLIEGQLSRVFSGCQLRDGALLWSLVALPETHDSFFERLREKKSRLTGPLLDWIDKLQGVLFGPENRAAWGAMRPFLGTQPEGKLDTKAFEGLMDALPPRATADRQALEVYRSLFPTANETVADTQLPETWRPLAGACRSLRELRRQLGEKGISAIRANRLLEQGTKRVNSVECDNPLVNALVTAWRQAWRNELERWRDLLVPCESVDWLRPDNDVLRVVEGEDAPLKLYLRNQGPDDIRETVRFWVDRSSKVLFAGTEGLSVERLGLQCAAEDGQEGEALPLSGRIRARLLGRPLDIPVHWAIGDRRRKQVIRIHPEARWNQYLKRYPRRDRLAANLFQSREGNAYRYRRIVVRRWRDFSLTAGRRDLIELIRSWAERAGRSEELRIFTTEAVWPEAEARSAERWEEYLSCEPRGLEVWLMEDSVPWGLRFLKVLASAPDTALLLPDLALEDTAAAISAQQHQLLDELLGLRGENRLAPLQLALKACVQGIVLVPAAEARKLDPVALGASVRHSAKRLLSRAEVPDTATWKDSRVGRWPVAGCRDLTSLAELPPDLTRPLGVLVESDPMHLLWRLGLIMRWGGLWIPRSLALFGYVDEAFPTRRAGESPDRRDGSPTRNWDIAGWKGQALETAQRRLFSRGDKPLDHPPFEGLDISEWESLQGHLQRHGAPEGFYRFLGLDGRQHFNLVLANLKNWRDVMIGVRRALNPLLRHLGEDDVGNEELPTISVGGRDFDLVGLIPGGMGGGRFDRLLLLVPDAGFYRALRRSHERLVDHMDPWLADIRAQLPERWKNAIALIFFDSEARDATGLAYLHDLVLLDSRAAMRLASSRSPRQALLEAIMSQIPLKDLAQDVFQSEGPVKHAERFFGREHELRHICEGLAHGKSYVVTGPRSIGKSSLLVHLPRSAYWQQNLSRHFFPITLDLQEQRSGLDYAHFLDLLVRAVDRAGLRLPGELTGEVRALIKADEALSSASAKTATAQVLDALEKELSPRIPVLLVDEADGFYEADRTQGEPVFTLFRARHNADRLRFVFASYPPRRRAWQAPFATPRPRPTTSSSSWTWGRWSARLASVWCSVAWPRSESASAIGRSAHSATAPGPSQTSYRRSVSSC